MTAPGRVLGQRLPSEELAGRAGLLASPPALPLTCHSGLTREPLSLQRATWPRGHHNAARRHPDRRSLFSTKDALNPQERHQTALKNGQGTEPPPRSSLSSSPPTTPNTPPERPLQEAPPATCSGSSALLKSASSEEFRGFPPPSPALSPAFPNTGSWQLRKSHDVLRASVRPQSRGRAPANPTAPWQTRCRKHVHVLHAPFWQRGFRTLCAPFCLVSLPNPTPGTVPGGLPGGFSSSLPGGLGARGSDTFPRVSHADVGQEPADHQKGQDEENHVPL